MRKMIPTDFDLTLPNIRGHRCTCIKSHDQSRIISPRVRQEFLIPVKMAENLLGYARNKMYSPVTCLCHAQIRGMTVGHVSFRWTCIALHSVLTDPRTP